MVSLACSCCSPCDNTACSSMKMNVLRASLCILRHKSACLEKWVKVLEKQAHLHCSVRVEFLPSFLTDFHRWWTFLVILLGLWALTKESGKWGQDVVSSQFGKCFVFFPYFFPCFNLNWNDEHTFSGTYSIYGVLQNLKAQKVGEKVCTPSVML